MIVVTFVLSFNYSTILSFASELKSYYKMGENKDTIEDKKYYL